MTTILTLALQTYFLTALLVRLDGPFEIFTYLRAFLGVKKSDLDGECTWSNEISHALCCSFCTSVYVAGILAVIQQIAFFDLLAALGIVYLVLDWMRHGLE